MEPLSVYGNEPNCVFDLEARNRKAHSIITRYAGAHAAMDVTIGLTAWIPIPGATTAALIAAICAQAPLIYKPMTRELARIYSSEEDATTDSITKDTVLIGAGLDIAIELGSEFMQEIASDLIFEAGLGLGISAIPFFGALLAAGLDAAIAATLTWRVGTMVSAYYQNGEAWVENRRATYDYAKKFVGSYSPKVENRANLDDFGRQNPAISAKQLAFVLNLIETLRVVAPNREQVSQVLRSRNVPSWLIDEGLRRAFAG
jgi:hypothetical protein